ncbi:alpha/beta family hydrolase [Colwelliaceae bacterium MEBiC 14330]
MSQKQIIVRADGSIINLLADTVPDAKALVVFAHGAGADMSHEFMTTVSQLLNKERVNVLRFNFPFMDKRALTGKKSPPDRMPKLLACYEEVLANLVNKDGNKLPLFIGGKSMGSRAATTLLMEAEALTQDIYDKVKGIVCLGYPFHPAKKPENLRLAPLFSDNKPILIIQGERDSLGNKTEIMSYNLPQLCQCVFLEDGDHSLKPRVKSGFTYDVHLQQAVKEIVKFIDNQTGINN